jgi:hypothetical protein
VGEEIGVELPPRPRQGVHRQPRPPRRLRRP